MLHRKILIICEQDDLRLHLRDCLLTELSDIRLTESNSAMDAMTKLTSTHFEIIIFEFSCCNEMWSQMRRAVSGQLTSFLPVANATDAERLRQLGISAIAVPCQPLILATEVNRLCNPRGFRQHLRVSIPGARAVIHVGDCIFRGEVLNVGLGGILCDIPKNDQYKVLLDAVHIHFSTIENFGMTDLELSGRFTRMALVTPPEPGAPEIVRIAWRFVDMEPSQQEILSSLVEHARETFNINTGTTDSSATPGS